VRQFASSPSNTYALNHPAVSSPMIVAGPSQAYNYHRAQFPQPQQVPAQLMPPPPQQLQQALPQHGQPSVSQQTPAVRPRPVVDLTTDDERVSKRPRMASDPNVYAQQRSPGLSVHPQHQVYTQTAFQTPAKLQQRTSQPRPQMVPTNHMQNQFIQPHPPQRSMTAPNSYQHVLSPTSPPPRTNSFSSIPPTPPTSAPPVMDAYRIVAGEVSATPTQGPLSNARGQMQGFSQPQQVDTGPAHPASVASQPSVADAGTNVVTTANPVGAQAERSTGTPLASTPSAPPPDSIPASPQVSSSQVQDGESSLPPLTEEQAEEMRSELADSMFSELEEGDEIQTRVCLLCE